MLQQLQLAIYQQVWVNGQKPMCAMRVGVMALLFLAGGALLIRQARQRLRSPSGMFDASVAELQRDQAELRAASGQHAQR